MAKPQKVSVILPAYNERENVIPLVAALHESLSRFEHEILVVDDNSPDGTAQAIAALADSRVRCIVRTEDRGFAKSIRCGLENATGDVFVIMDSDFNHQPHYLPAMIDGLRFYDCVSGSRFVYGGKMDTKTRHLLSWGFNIFTRAMTGGRVTDSLYGFLAIKREVMQSIRYDDVFWGYGDYCIRLLYYLQRDERTILQIPVVNGKRPAGDGNDRFVAVFWQYFREVVTLTYRARVKGDDATFR
jgi:dolichol-phosphate mannosyltransferase